MDLPMRGQNGITIGDALRGALTGLPDGDLLTDPGLTGHILLPSGKAFGMNIMTILESFVLKDEQYPRPLYLA